MVREQALDIRPGHDDGVKPVRSPKPQVNFPYAKKGARRMHTLRGRSVGMSW